MRVDPVRSGVTFLGVAGAGVLVWLATLFSFDSTGGFWSACGLLVGAGLVLGVSQILGGWTGWGWPRFSVGVFVLGFLPALIVVGWIHLATQPAGGWQQQRLEGWSTDLGIGDFVADVGVFAPVLAAGLGVVLAFLIDTGGPRAQHVAGTEPTRAAADSGRDSLSGEATQAALYAEAQRLEIEGRSQMSKEELEEAVQDAHARAQAEQHDDAPNGAAHPPEQRPHKDADQPGPHKHSTPQV